MWTCCILNIWWLFRYNFYVIMNWACHFNKTTQKGMEVGILCIHYLITLSSISQIIIIFIIIIIYLLEYYIIHIRL